MMMNGQNEIEDKERKIIEGQDTKEHGIRGEGTPDPTAGHNHMAIVKKQTHRMPMAANMDR